MYFVRPAPRAVIFDFFGTLTKAVRRGRRHAAIARSLGCEPERFFAELDRTFFARASGRYGSPIEALRRVAYAAGGRPGLTQLVDAAMDRVEAVRADTALRPEAASVLAALRERGLPTVVLSDCWYELPAFLPRMPVAQYLAGCVYSIDIGRCKPHPAMYLEACRRLRVDPEECVYLGDGGSHELSGARDVGMLPVRLVAPDLTGHLVFGADRRWAGPTVRSLTNLLPLVDSEGAKQRRLARTLIA